MTNSTKSHARAAQQKHWETLGQIGSMLGMTRYILSHNRYLLPSVKSSLKAAEVLLHVAFQREQQNNEFINLKLPRGF